MDRAEKEAVAELEATRERMHWFITSAPLFEPVLLSSKFEPMPHRAYIVGSDVVPHAITMTCDLCGVSTNWERLRITDQQSGDLGSAAYKCRNCGKAAHTVIYIFDEVAGTVTLRKVGVWPAPKIDPPKEVQKAIGHDGIRFYRAGLTLRTHGYGLGAFVYFRRIVEDTTDELLRLLEEAIRESDGDAEAVAEKLAIIATAREAPRFEDKVKAAADALPNHLKLKGSNPLKLLFKLLSDGIHARSDEECIAIVDDIDQVMRYLIVALKEHQADKQKFAGSIKSLQSAASQRTKK